MTHAERLRQESDIESYTSRLAVFAAMQDAAAALEAIEAAVVKWRVKAETARESVAIGGDGDPLAMGIAQACEECADRIDAILHPKEPHELA